MNSRMLAVLICMALFTWQDARAQSDHVSSFFMAPIRTDVHRAVIADGASAYAVVNGSALVREAKFDAAALDEPRFASELKRLAAKPPSHLILVLRYQPPDELDESLKTNIRTRLEDVARGAGFQTITSREMFTTADWKEVSAQLHTVAEKADARERIFEDDLIRAYLARTKLSKLVVGDSDFVVEIKQPFDGRQTDLAEPLRASIKKAIQTADLGDKKGKLQFRLSSTTAGEEPIQRLFSPQLPLKIPTDVTNPALLEILKKEAAKYKPSQAMELALELGFESITYSHSPGGGAPEKLIGERVPDFTLESLAGDKLALRSFIGNRPALVTFWGVACGPCCVEAPHLTKMHQKYGKEFAIVAVNGYDESREVVAKFAEQAKLEHPIVLGGSTVAENFHVGAYPTTFWINREGTVVDYKVDFDSAARLERRIVEMLKRE